MVPRGGIEPPTQGFSEYCFTKSAINKDFIGVLKLVCDKVCVMRKDCYLFTTKQDLFF
jgi:hypothetical protein